MTLSNIKFTLLVGALIVAMSFQPRPTCTLQLTQQEAQTLYQLIDDSPTPGQVRKPLLQKIAIAYQVAWPDSTQVPVKPQPKKQ